MPGMIDYMNSKNFENYMVNALLDKFKYLVDIRSSIIDDLENVNSMINDILSEMESAGIHIDI
jgi:uncharacterized protein (DUF2344 family)